jgi:murein DD-endopeptidase MepM/ murein hydrolase activator NlpD
VLDTPPAAPLPSAPAGLEPEWGDVAPRLELAPDQGSSDTTPASPQSPSQRANPEPPRAESAGPVELTLIERSTGCQSSFRAGVGNPCPVNPNPGVNPGGPGSPINPVLAQALYGGTVAGSKGGHGGNGGNAAVYQGAVSFGGNATQFYRRTPRPQGRMGNNFKLMYPVAIPAVISSVFGWRVHPISGDARFHSGTDIAAPQGTPVLAAYGGQVALADFLGGYGLTVTLAHNQGQQETLYAHLSEIFVRPGEVVKQGDVIGRVGSTGNSTGPHLHFELRENTNQGYVAVDAGEALDYALAQLGQSMQLAQMTPKLGPYQPGKEPPFKPQRVTISRWYNISNAPNSPLRGN